MRLLDGHVSERTDTALYLDNLDLHGVRWYRRDEAQKRFTFLFSGVTVAGAFGGLLASAIGNMGGIRGMLGWRWVFILGKAFHFMFQRSSSCLFFAP